MFEDVMTFLFSTERGRQVGLATVGICGVAAALTFASMIFNWHSDFVLSRQPIIIKKSVSLADENMLLIASIPEQHIFGFSAAEDAFLPITSLQLHLTGIIKVENEALSRVIISEAGQTGKVFAIGDELAAGIKINAINDDGIVVENSGKLEKLPLVRSSLVFQDKPKTLWQNKSEE